MLGVMKAGGAFVPLDPTHPTSRLQRLIESVEASVALCSQNHADTLQPIVQTLIPLCTETMDRLAEPADGVNLASGVTSQNAAYVLFTSGSTGEPKVHSQPEQVAGKHVADNCHRELFWNIAPSSLVRRPMPPAFSSSATRDACNSQLTHSMPVSRNH